MRIHILTLPIGHNYGGILQAYALNAVLQKMGHEALTIKYNWEYSRPKPQVVVVRVLSWIKCIVLRCLGNDKNICNPFGKIYQPNKDLSELKEFCKKHIKQTKACVGTSGFNKLIEKSPGDAYIVGSDQVWRRAYCPYLSDFYLANVPDTIPKISYAASFGKDNLDEYTQEEIDFARPLIQRFKSVSVREASGIDICQNHFGVSAVQTLDPTMLLSADDYMSCISPKNSYPRHHLGVYMLDGTNEKKQFIEKASKELGLTISRIDVTENHDRYIKYPSIENWLANIAFADYVITDSFHGMVFSIIFQKQFAVIGNPGRGMTRFTSLLEELEIPNRLVEGNQLPSDSIDYTTVNKHLNRLREKSINWLNANLK